MSFDIGSIINSAGRSTQQADQNLNTTIQNADSSNPTDMINMQRALQEWSMAVSFESSVTKTLGDTVRGIIQKMN